MKSIEECIGGRKDDTIKALERPLVEEDLDERDVKEYIVKTINSRSNCSKMDGA